VGSGNNGDEDEEKRRVDGQKYKERDENSDEDNDGTERASGFTENVEGDAVFVATNSPVIRVYDVKTLNARLLVGHNDTVISLCISADNRFLLSGSKDTTIRLWRLNEAGTVTIEKANVPGGSSTVRILHPPVCVGVVSGHTKGIGAVACCRLPQHAYFFSTSRDTTLKRWDYGRLLRRKKKKNKMMMMMIEGKEASHSSTDDSGGIEELKKSADGVVAHLKDINGLAVSADDNLVATGSSDRTVKLWKANDLTSPLATLKGHKRGVWSVVFSPVDRVVCSSSGDQTIKIWAVDGDFACLRTFQGHEASVTQVCFINAGTQLLSASSDAAVKLWTIKTNECINTFAEEAHEDKIWALRCWGDGGSIVTGGEDSRIVFWHDATEEEEEAERMEREHNILKEQELRNCLRNKEWAKAIRIALKLSHSRQLFKIFRHLYRHASTDEVLREALGDCTIEERARIVLWSREWNTHTDYVPVAHFVLSRLLREHALLDGANTTVSSEIRQPLREAAQHIIRYSERHLKRLDKLLQRTYLLDYMLASTSILQELPDSRAINDGGKNEYLLGGGALPAEVESSDEDDGDDEDDHDNDHSDENDAILVRVTKDPLENVNNGDGEEEDGEGLEGFGEMESNWDDDDEGNGDDDVHDNRDSKNDDVAVKVNHERDDAVKKNSSKKKKKTPNQTKKGQKRKISFAGNSADNGNKSSPKSAAKKSKVGKEKNASAKTNKENGRVKKKKNGKKKSHKKK